MGVRGGGEGCTWCAGGAGCTWGAGGAGGVGGCGGGGRRGGGLQEVVHTPNCGSFVVSCEPVPLHHGQAWASGTPA